MHVLHDAHQRPGHLEKVLHAGRGGHAGLRQIHHCVLFLTQDARQVRVSAQSDGTMRVRSARGGRARRMATYRRFSGAQFCPRNAEQYGGVQFDAGRHVPLEWHHGGAAADLRALRRREHSGRFRRDHHIADCMHLHGRPGHDWLRSHHAAAVRGRLHADRCYAGEAATAERRPGGLVWLRSDSVSAQFRTYSRRV